MLDVHVESRSKIVFSMYWGPWQAATSPKLGRSKLLSVEFSRASHYSFGGKKTCNHGHVTGNFSTLCHNQQCKNPMVSIIMLHCRICLSCRWIGSLPDVQVLAAFRSRPEFWAKSTLQKNVSQSLQISSSANSTHVRWSFPVSWVVWLSLLNASAVLNLYI